MTTERLRAALVGLEAEGCPMAASSMHDKCIEVSQRRWRSFDRRNRRRPPTPEDRVEDLARGLWQAFETRGLPPGPELQDYRCVARAMAQVLTVDERDLPPARA